MPITVKKIGIDLQAIKPRVLKNASSEALKYVGQTIVEDTEEFVPMSRGKGKGTLRKSAKITKHKDNELELSYSRMIYWEDEEGNRHAVNGAPYVYEGLNPVKSVTSGANVPIMNYTTSGTGPFWIETSTQENIESWKRQFTKVVIDSLKEQGD